MRQLAAPVAPGVIFPEAAVSVVDLEAAVASEDLVVVAPAVVVPEGVGRN